MTQNFFKHQGLIFVEILHQGVPVKEKSLGWLTLYTTSRSC